MGLIIQRLDGTSYNTDDYGLRPVDFTPDSPAYQTPYADIGGRDGAVDEGTTVGVRKLNAKFSMMARDSLDFPLLRNEIFKLFHSKEEFYLIDEQEPGKRWKKVKVDPYTIKRLRYVKGEVELTFNAAFPYAESIGTTQDSFDTESGLWQVGQGLLLDEESQQYNFEIPSFKVWNAGDVTVNPEEMPLKITITGAFDDVFLRNVDTNETFRYYAPLTASDTLVLDGVKVLKNGVSVFKDTNYTPLTLQPGWNTIVVDHYTGPFTISFDHRFYYL